VALTYAQVHRRVWEFAHSQVVTIRLRDPDETLWGYVTVRLGEHRVRVHATKAEDIIRTLIHELLHSAFRSELAPFGEVEEDIVLMLEQRVWAFVVARPAVLNRWRKYVAALKEAASA